MALNPQARDDVDLPIGLLAQLERELDRLIDLLPDDRERALRDLEAIDLTLAAYARWALTARRNVLDRGAGELARAMDESRSRWRGEA